MQRFLKREKSPEEIRWSNELDWLEGALKRQAKLKGSVEDYQIRELRKWNEKELRKEYSRLRAIAQKRIQRLGESKYSTSQAYLQNVGKYPKLRDIQSTQELLYAVRDVARFISAKRGSVQGQRAIELQTLTALRTHGYKFVSEENYMDFGEFWGYVRDNNLDKLYDSSQVVDLWEQLRSVDTLTLDDFVRMYNAEDIEEAFRWYMEHKEEIGARIREVKSANKNATAEDYYKALHGID